MQLCCQIMLQSVLSHIPFQFDFLCEENIKELLMALKILPPQKISLKYTSPFPPSQLQSCNNVFIQILPACFSLLMSSPIFLFWSFCKYYYNCFFRFSFISCPATKIQQIITLHSIDSIALTGGRTAFLFLSEIIYR